MAAIQLTFTLRTSANCQSVHLVGNWDGYQGQIPLSKDSHKAGAWKGTFRFQSATLQPGQRYWYYYIIDGYHASHDPAKESVVEPTTGRQLNTLDIPASKKSSSSSSHRHSRRHSREVAQGRPISPSRLQHPRPQKPHATRQLRTADYSGHATVDELTQRFAATNMYAHESDSEFESDSDDNSDVPSLGSDCSSRPGSAGSVSSTSSRCSCDRFGITRRGDRVRLDCGGSRCGGKYADDSCSEFEDDDVYYERSTRRQGVVVRH